MQKKANKTLITKTLETLLMQQLSRNTSKTEKEYSDEAFLKFVSDSRDWAYTYIEDVQESLNKFITDMMEEVLQEAGRKILVLSDRLEHLKLLKKICMK